MESKSQLKFYQILNVIGYILTVAVNILAVALPIGGQTAGKDSSKLTDLFTPAGFTFSIWWLIYFMLLLFTLYQAGVFQGKKHSDLRFVYNIGLLFFVASLANIAWVIVWRYELLFLSVAIMVVLLISLIAIYARIRENQCPSDQERFFVRAPFSIYLGWICAATISSVMILLNSIGWSGFGIAPEIWTIIAIAFAVFLALRMLSRRRDILYALTIIWALIGILARHLAGFQGLKTKGVVYYNGIIATAIIGIALILIGIVLAALKKKEGKGKKR